MANKLDSLDIVQYVIITPAYNEADNIETTIQGVLNQTSMPLLWVIVDDGSTDGTADIIKAYSKNNKFIKYHYRQKPDGQLYFSSNVYAIEEGYQVIKKIKCGIESEQKSPDFDYIGILDADITLTNTYYKTIITRMKQDEKLGIASGIYQNLINGKLEPVLNDRRSTPKAIMVFRRECFEEIDGFIPMEYGGEDTVACVMARMKKWKVWSYPDVKVVHRRPTGLGNAQSLLQAKYNLGFYEYGLGSHPLFVTIKSLLRAFREKPYLLGALARLYGFMMGYVTRKQRMVTKEFISFIRKEQISRIISMNAIPESNHVKGFEKKGAGNE